MHARDIEKILRDDGWILKTQKGSHRQYIHPSKSGKVTIPWHKGDLDTGTTRSILRQAGIQKERET